MTHTGYFIINIGKKYISLDLWFKTKEEAEECLTSSLYTERERKTRRIVESYNGNYIKLNDKFVSVE